MAGGGMQGEGGLLFLVVAKGGFVVEHIHMAYVGDDVFRIAGVRAKGIGALPVGGLGDLFVGDDMSAFGCVIRPVFDGMYLMYGYVVFVDIPLADVQLPGFFDEKKSRGGHFVFQREGIDFHPEVFVNLCFFVGLEGMKTDPVVKLSFVVAYDISNAFFQGFMGIDVEVFFSVEQVERREQAKEPVYMVAVQVADEDVVDAAKFNAVAPELHLCSLAAVDQEKPLIYVEYMSGQVSFRGWQSRAASQYGQFKSHILTYWSSPSLEVRFSSSTSMISRASPLE